MRWRACRCCDPTMSPAPSSSPTRARSTSTSFTRVFCAARVSAAPRSSPMRASMRIERHGDRWHLQTNQGTFAAPVVVNAAGAWADNIAGSGRRRADRPGAEAPHRIPCRGAGRRLDCRLAAGQRCRRGILLQAGRRPDFRLAVGCDAERADGRLSRRLDVAIGVDRLQRATTIEVRRIEHQWAGLRSFVSDGSPVVGFDDNAEGFFWLAGQGGYGIKTSPALARACRELIHTGRLPDDLLRQGIEPGDLAPGRIRTTSHDQNEQDRA